MVDVTCANVFFDDLDGVEELFLRERVFPWPETGEGGGSWVWLEVLGKIAEVPPLFCLVVEDEHGVVGAEGVVAVVVNGSAEASGWESKIGVGRWG